MVHYGALSSASYVEREIAALVPGYRPAVDDAPAGEFVRRVSIRVAIRPLCRRRGCHYDSNRGPPGADDTRAALPRSSS